MAKTIREAYGEALVTYGKEDPRVVVLDADVSGSTKSAVLARRVRNDFLMWALLKAT